MQLRKCFVSIEFFQRLLLYGRSMYFLSRFPGDATIRNVSYDADRGGFWLVITSNTYEDIPEGHVLPEATILVRTLEEREA